MAQLNSPAPAVLEIQAAPDSEVIDTPAAQTAQSDYTGERTM